jgi:S1-C subfamily serine protease
MRTGGAPVRRLSDLTGQLERAGVGSKVALDVMRDGRHRTVEVPIVDVTREG